LGLFVSQVMTKHRKNVQELVDIAKNLMKDTFLCEQNIQNIAERLTKETYKKHEIDVESVRMWA
jgi:spore germination protein YaaH